VEIEYLEQSGSCHRPDGQVPNIRRFGSAPREELIQQRYLEDPGYRSHSSAEASSTNFQRYRTPSDFEVLIGRNNRQNDQLTSSGWGLRPLVPRSRNSREPCTTTSRAGAVPDEADLQFAADLTAYYSRSAKVTKCQLSTRKSTSTSLKELNRELRFTSKSVFFGDSPSADMNISSR